MFVMDFMFWLWGLDKSFVVKSFKMVKDRVNCIMLWFLMFFIFICDGLYIFFVVVFVNNDCIVILVSLDEFEVDEKSELLVIIIYFDFVNWVIIFLDGWFLIVIFDDLYLYVYERVLKLVELLWIRER